MTEYGKGAWNAKARKRKAIRDKAREAFWASVGVNPKDVSEIEIAPRGQLLPIVRLLQATRDGLDAPDVAFLAGVARSLRTVGLGQGAMGAVTKQIIPIDTLGTFDLEAFFLNDYKYEGPRNERRSGEDVGSGGEALVHVPGCTSGPRRA